MDDITELKLKINDIAQLIMDISGDEMTPYQFKVLKKLQSEDPDIVLKCANGEVNANKAILCARSPQFNAMITGSFSESSGDINFPEYGSSEMQMLVDYITTRRYPKDNISGEWYELTNGVITLGFAYDQPKLSRKLIEHRANSLFHKGTWEFTHEYESEINLYHRQEDCRGMSFGVGTGVYIDMETETNQSGLETYTYTFRYGGENHDEYKGVFLVANYDSRTDSARKRWKYICPDEFDSMMINAYNGT